MADDKARGAADDVAHPLNSVRNAHDVEQYHVLRSDPADEDANADIANDESFPASDAPSHASAHHSEPATSSLFDESAGRTISDRRHEVAAREDAIHLDGGEASGGRKLGTMRYVLAISLVAIVVIFAILLITYRSDIAIQAQTRRL